METGNIVIGLKRESGEKFHADEMKKKKKTKSDKTIDAVAAAAADAADVDNEFIDDDDEANRCIICRVDMGECNPRQLCGKGRCLQETAVAAAAAADVDDRDDAGGDDDDDDDDVKEKNDDSDLHFPSLEDMQAPGIRAFSSLDSETVYHIINFEKRTEKFRDEEKNNLILTLRGKGSRSMIEVRATGVVQKTLIGKHKMESLFPNHNFYIRYLGEKKSSRTGNMFCNFCISSKVK